MSPRPFLHRATMLLALSALLPGAAEAQRQDDLVGDLLRGFWSMCPDLETAETREAIVQDLKARIENGPNGLARACSDLGTLLDRWATGGREAVVVYDTNTPAGVWGALVRFRGPSDYLAESYCHPAGERGEVQIQPRASLHEAIEVAMRRARDLQLERATAQVSRALGHDVRPEVAALLNPPTDFGEQWRKLRQSLLEASAKAPMVTVGETMTGPITPAREMSADEFTRRYGIRDDLVKEPPTAEQRAKMQAWMDEVTAKRGPLPVSRAEWQPEDAADLAAKNRDARDRLFRAYQAGDGGSKPDATDPVTFDAVIAMGCRWLADCDPDAAGVLVHLGTGPETVMTDPRFVAALAAGEIRQRGDRDWFFTRALVLREPGRMSGLEARLLLDEAAGCSTEPVPRQIRRPTFHEALQEMGADMGAVTQAQADEAARRAYGPEGATQARLTVQEDPFTRTQRFAFSTPARVMVAQRSPVDFKRAGEQSRARLGNSIKPPDTTAARIYEQAAHALVKPRPKAIRDPELRAEQAERRRKRGAAKRRRGWA